MNRGTETGEGGKSNHSESLLFSGVSQTGVGSVERAVLRIFPSGEQRGGKLQRICCPERVELQ